MIHRCVYFLDPRDLIAGHDDRVIGEMLAENFSAVVSQKCDRGEAPRASEGQSGAEVGLYRAR